MANFPKDQFDAIPVDLTRIGAHRAPKPRGRGWIRFAWAALATGILVVGGLYGLSRAVPGISFELPNLGGDGGGSGASPSASADTVPAAAPTTKDPVTPANPLTVSVFNGSSKNNVQNTAGDALKAAGWSDPARFNATKRDEPETVIYYSSPAYEAIAKGIASTLGTGRPQLSDAFPGAPVTIVLGEDYATLAGG